ncbi:MAG: hypothetical protein AB8I08_18465 [Sandaracinaceae bacterium]
MEAIWSLLGPILVGFALVEFGMLYLAPGLTARLAPFGAGLDRTLHVPAAQLRGSLPNPSLHGGAEYVTKWDADAGAAWVRLTYKFFGFNRSLGIGRVQVRTDSQESPASYRDAATEPTVRVDVSVRWMPVPMALFPLLLAAGVVSLTVFQGPLSLGLLVGGTVGGGLSGIMTYWRIKPALSEVADEIERAFERPAARGALDPV